MCPLATGMSTIGYRLDTKCRNPGISPNHKSLYHKLQQCLKNDSESLRKRFATYEEQTKPVIEKFRSASKLHEVDSTVPAADVAAAVSKIIEADSLLVKK